MAASTREGLRWLWGAEAVKVAGKSGIPHAPGRGAAAPPLRSAGAPCGDAGHAGSLLVSAVAPGQPRRLPPGCRRQRGEPHRLRATAGESAFPRIRFVALVENGAHAVFGARLGCFEAGATTLARQGLTALVRQEFWGLLLAHVAVRGLTHEAALRAGEDPDRRSFRHAVRVMRRKPPLFAALPPRARRSPHAAMLDKILEERVASSRGRQAPRGVKRKMSNHRRRPRASRPATHRGFAAAVPTLK